MISHLSHTTIQVLDQTSAKAFYTETLGFEVRSDVVETILADCAMGRDPQAAQ